jgi:hypothetical protein
MKRPPWERDRLLRLIRITVVAGALIVVLGLVAVVGGVFEPSKSERAQGWIAREYGARLGDCEELSGNRLVCDLELPTPKLLDRAGRPPGDRLCVFVLDDESVVVEGYAPCA